MKATWQHRSWSCIFFPKAQKFLVTTCAYHYPTSIVKVDGLLLKTASTTAQKQCKGFLRTLCAFHASGFFSNTAPGTSPKTLQGVLVNTCACHAPILKSAGVYFQNCSRQIPTRNPKFDDMRTKQLFRRQAGPAAQQTRMVNIMEEYCHEPLGQFLSDKPAGRIIWLSQKSSRVRSCLSFWFFSQSPEQSWRMLFWMMAIVTVMILSVCNRCLIYPALDIYLLLLYNAVLLLENYWGGPRKQDQNSDRFGGLIGGLWCGHFCSMQFGMLLSFCQCMVIILGSFEIAWVKLAFKAEVRREQGLICKDNPNSHALCIRGSFAKAIYCA